MAVALPLAIHGDRLQQQLQQLATIGRQPDGAICRLAFSPADLQARSLVQQWMVDAGLTIRTDSAGNLIGTWAGTVPGAPALATGSHIDTVPSGGPYDGVLGVLAGLEVVRTLRDQALRLRHPLEVIVFTDEESSMIGSQAMAGTVLYEAPDRYHPTIGEPIQRCLEQVGGNWEALATARRTRQDMAAFVELHVEQGAVLERTGKTIGIVQGVVGMRRLRLTVTGQANHAGTTPMADRQDALVAAAELVLAVRQLVDRPSQPVATVGALTVQPNAVNIIPGRVDLSVDLRDLDRASLVAMVLELEQRATAIAAATGTRVTIEPGLTVEPTLAAPGIQAVMVQVCEQLGLPYGHLPSRAGHDALELGRMTDMGMIFVPSQAGISHDGTEFTSLADCVAGTNVLLQTLLQLDQQYNI